MRRCLLPRHFPHTLQDVSRLCDCVCVCVFLCVFWQGRALSKLPVINMKFAQNRHFYKVSKANIA